MKNLLIALMLGILMLAGEQWEQVSPGKYRLVYLVFERSVETKDGKRCEKWNFPMCDAVDRIRFTIPVPNTATKAMSKEEAEKLNKELMKP